MMLCFLQFPNPLAMLDQELGKFLNMSIVIKFESKLLASVEFKIGKIKDQDLTNYKGIWYHPTFDICIENLINMDSRHKIH